ncbi:MAG: DUF480 domain-containing protein [Fibrobacter sp.]|nr:DUF480 domain-containing protein [Fibrobacter sp.]
MELNLNPVEIRILGALIEKEITTPEYYPLSLNSLVAACNQKSNRDPVMNLEEADVSSVLESLRDKKLVWQLSTAGGRVPKYEHNFRSFFKISKSETAILCVLLLRGPQTPGELKGRSERLYQFESLDEVETSLKNLIAYTGGPLVMELPRMPGQKERRYIHLFSQEILEQLQSIQNNPEENTQTHGIKDRYTVLEQQILQLREELNALRTDYEEFKKQLE